ncbi:flagellar protein FliO/FliZ [Sphaerotilus hippei]|uniref:Flagellar protein FliO/FliZ n=1 Tax=Sphaerotilus hippei TaxID=744406 RepID=A0A318GU43_9BURK|nr:flagellar biosynthetic protein FliO [Sphaerotilus hippei]PXW91943.1 flagellar protein FliO/FliZ [Sphaerotilus hippei]
MWMPLVWLVVIVALIPAALLLLRRSRVGGLLVRPAQGGGPRLVASLGLGPQQRVVTIEVGEGEARRCLVLGVTPHQITALHQWQPPEASVAEPPSGPVTGGGFALALNRFRRDLSGGSSGGDHGPR